MASILLAGLPYELEGAVNRALAAQGHAVNTAREADQALRVITRSPPALAIVGTGLTGSKGLHFCSHVRNIPEGQDLPIIFLTDRDSLADKLDGFAAGVDDVLPVLCFGLGDVPVSLGGDFVDDLHELVAELGLKTIQPFGRGDQ